ncbi:MAG: endonuclease MutS2 [Oscillospiraceae bacterium]
MEEDYKYCKTLELDKILTQLAEFTCCDYAKERVLSIKPSTNFKIVSDELEKTNAAFYLSSNYGTPHFSKMSVPDEYLRLAELGGVLSARQLLNIATILRQVRLLTAWNKQCQNKQTALKNVFELLVSNNNLEEQISRTFISEDEIDDYASDELAHIRRKIKSIGSQIKDTLDKMTRSATYQKALQENIVTMRDGRYVLPVKAEYKNVVSGLVHDTSASGATFFIEPMAVVEANNAIKVLLSQEKAEIERIFAELSAMCGDNSQTIINDFSTIISLNIYFSKSSLAEKMRATAPEIVTTGYIKLNKARHPLINKDLVVPTDIEAGGTYKTLLITGPNTGGKTVTLKTIGLLTLMTMCGMLIPVADGSVISIYDKILVDIGDEQSIEQSLSTFSAHMTNIISIIDNATEKSLVLLDELGSGTDPIEGAALAMSILEKLKSQGSTVVATTHYAELKVYALKTDLVENACCEFDVNTLRPTYRLIIGTPGRSNAFEISQKLGLGIDILKKAKELVSNDKQSFEDVIDGLERSRLEYEKKSVELEKATKELETLKHQLKNINQTTLEEKERVIEQARREATKIVDTVKNQSQSLVDELDEIRKSKDKAEFSQLALNAKTQLRSKIDKLHNSANPVSERNNDNYILPRSLKVGDSVLLVDIDKTAVVLQPVDSKGNVLVQAGIMKTRTNVKNIKLLDNKPKTTYKGKTTKSISSNSSRAASMELDLRGFTVEEGIAAVDMFINNSILSNVNIVTIIHGKGTGALRAAVHTYLKSSKYVKSYRLGVYGEGESGVTIVEIK